MTPAEQAKVKILELQNLFITNHPQLPVLLRIIHTELLQDPEIVTIYSEEDIGILVQALIRHTGIEIASTKPKTSERARLSKLTVDDL